MENGSPTKPSYMQAFAHRSKWDIVKTVFSIRMANFLRQAEFRHNFAPETMLLAKNTYSYQMLLIFAELVARLVLSKYG